MAGDFSEPLTSCRAESVLKENEYSEPEKLSLSWELIFLVHGNLVCFLITAGQAFA